MIGRPVEITQADATAAFFTPGQIQRTFLWGQSVPLGVTVRILRLWYMTLKLFGAGAAEIPVTAKVFLARRRRGEHSPEFLAEIPYSKYFGLTLSEQQNAEWAERLRHEIAPANQEGWEFKEGDRLELYLESAVAVDLAQANRVQFTEYWDN